VVSKVIGYKNNERVSICQIKFSSGEKVLVSFAALPVPSIKIMRLLFGIFPHTTIWEYRVPAGTEEGCDMLIALLADQKSPAVNHPLDAAIRKLLPCMSCAEALEVLQLAEASAGAAHRRS